MCVITECFQYSSINNKHCIIELSNGDICFLFAYFYQIKAHTSVLFANILFVLLNGSVMKAFPPWHSFLPEAASLIYRIKLTVGWSGCWCSFLDSLPVSDFPLYFRNYFWVSNQARKEMYTEYEWHTTEWDFF